MPYANISSDTILCAPTGANWWPDLLSLPAKCEVYFTAVNSSDLRHPSLTCLPGFSGSGSVGSGGPSLAPASPRSSLLTFGFPEGAANEKRYRSRDEAPFNRAPVSHELNLLTFQNPIW